MSRLLTIVALGYMILTTTECRQGWKTYGNGYFIYDSKTDFSTTRKLRIDGTFSAAPNITSKHALLSVYDANGDFFFEILIGPNLFYTAYNIGNVTEENLWNAPRISEGYAYAFTVTVAKNESGIGSQYTIKTDIPAISRSGFSVVVSGITFNFTRIKIKIGGNSPDPVRGVFFEGCLSNFTFQGVDIISTYFGQYPNNINPIRGEEIFVKNGHGFSNVSEPCDDVMTTSGPGSSTKLSTTAPWSLNTTTLWNSTTTTRANVTSLWPSPNNAKNIQLSLAVMLFNIWLTSIAK